MAVTDDTYDQMQALALRLRVLLTSHRLFASHGALGEAFAVAAALIAQQRGEHAADMPGATELRALSSELESVSEMLSFAVEDAECSARRAGVEIWRHLGLSSQPPRWNGPESDSARELLAYTLVPSPVAGGHGAAIALRRVAAARWAGLIATELVLGDERVWRRALRERYHPVRNLCAPPKLLFDRGGLRGLVRSDRALAFALRDALCQWLTDGADTSALPAALETVFVARYAACHPVWVLA